VFSVLCKYFGSLCCVGVLGSFKCLVAVLNVFKHYWLCVIGVVRWPASCVMLTCSRGVI